MRLLAIACVLQVGCVGAALLPPSRTEVGSTVVHGGAGAEVGFRASTGAHFASGTTGRRVPVDVGLGYVYEQSQPEPDTRPIALALEGTPPQPAAPGTALHGGYLELSRPLSRERRERSWIGLRTEVLAAGGEVGAGGSVRVQWELFGNASGAGAEGDSNGMVAFVSHGTAAVGVYLDSGVRRLGGETSWVTSGGVTLRLPFIFAFGLACK